MMVRLNVMQLVSIIVGSLTIVLGLAGGIGGGDKELPIFFGTLAVLVPTCV